MGVDEFGLRADDHDSSLRTNLGGKDMAASIRHLRSWFPDRPSGRLVAYLGEATLLGWNHRMPWEREKSPVAHWAAGQQRFHRLPEL